MISLLRLIKKTVAPSLPTCTVLFVRGLVSLDFILSKLGTMQVKSCIVVQLEWTLHVSELAQAQSAFNIVYQLHKHLLSQLTVNLNLIGTDGGEDTRLYWKHVLVNCDEFAPLHSSTALFQVRMGATPFKEVLNELSKQGERVKWFANTSSQRKKAKLATASIIVAAKLERRRVYLQL